MNAGSPRATPQLDVTIGAAGTRCEQLGENYMRNVMRALAHECAEAGLIAIAGFDASTRRAKMAERHHGSVRTAVAKLHM